MLSLKLYLKEYLMTCKMTYDDTHMYVCTQINVRREKEMILLETNLWKSMKRGNDRWLLEEYF